MTGTERLTDYCGPHCGTKDQRTRHCRHCHTWTLREADGCLRGWDGSSRWFEFSDTHEPTSHELGELGDQEQARVDALTFGD